MPARPDNHRAFLAGLAEQTGRRLVRARRRCDLDTGSSCSRQCFRLRQHVDGMLLRLPDALEGEMGVPRFGPGGVHDGQGLFPGVGLDRSPAHGPVSIRRPIGSNNHGPEQSQALSIVLHGPSSTWWVPPPDPCVRPRSAAVPTRISGRGCLLACTGHDLHGQRMWCRSA